MMSDLDGSAGKLLLGPRDPVRDVLLGPELRLGGDVQPLLLAAVGGAHLPAGRRVARLRGELGRRRRLAL